MENENTSKRCVRGHRFGQIEFAGSSSLGRAVVAGEHIELRSKRWWDPNEWTKENGEWRRKCKSSVSGQHFWYILRTSVLMWFYCNSGHRSMLEKENARVSPSAPEPEVVRASFRFVDAMWIRM